MNKRIVWIASASVCAVVALAVILSIVLQPPGNGCAFQACTHKCDGDNCAVNVCTDCRGHKFELDICEEPGCVEGKVEVPCVPCDGNGHTFANCVPCGGIGNIECTACDEGKIPCTEIGCDHEADGLDCVSGFNPCPCAANDGMIKCPETNCDDGVTDVQVPCVPCDEDGFTVEDCGECDGVGYEVTDVECDDCNGTGLTGDCDYRHVCTCGVWANGHTSACKINSCNCPCDNNDLGDCETECICVCDEPEHQCNCKGEHALTCRVWEIDDCDYVACDCGNYCDWKELGFEDDPDMTVDGAKTGQQNAKDADPRGLNPTPAP